MRRRKSSPPGAGTMSDQDTFDARIYLYSPSSPDEPWRLYWPLDAAAASGAAGLRRAADRWQRIVTSIHERTRAADGATGAVLLLGWRPVEVYEAPVGWEAWMRTHLRQLRLPEVTRD